MSVCLKYSDMLFVHRFTTLLWVHRPNISYNRITFTCKVFHVFIRIIMFNYHELFEMRRIV